MSYNEALNRGARRVLVTQALVTLLIAAGFGLMRGWSQALAALYGGMITILITGWLAWRLRRVTAQTRGSALAVIFSSAAVRYAAVAAQVAIGIGILKLAPLPLLSAFAVTQFGFLVNIRRTPL